MLAEKVDIGQMLREIIQQCSFGPLFVVDIGFSFTASRALDQKVQYMYCPREGATFGSTFLDRNEALAWADKLKGINDPLEMLAFAFINDEFGSNFKQSGWTARSAVAIHMWLQK